MYQEFRKLFDTIGRYIDNHRRFMLSNTRSAQSGQTGGLVVYEDLG